MRGMLSSSENQLKWGTLIMNRADMILKNGFVYTVDKYKNIAEAVAIEGNKIVYVGTNKGVEPYIGNSTQVIDLEGKMLLPGFVEAHAHPFVATCWLSGIIIDMTSSYEQILDTIKQNIEANPDKEVYYGIGYDENTVKANCDTKKEVLDAICKDKPILIQGSGGHEGWANSKALEIANVNKNTPDPIPGFSYFRRDEAGNPTGGIIEIGALSQITTAINPFDMNTATGVLEEILYGFNSIGITTVADCGIPEFMSEYIMPAVEELINTDRMTFRTVGCYMVGEESDAEVAVTRLNELRKKYDNDLFRINTLKIINDGTVETRSASFYEDYADGGSCAPFMEGEKLYSLCVEAAKEGFNINIHGIGDRTIHEILMAAKAVREAGYSDVRFTNSHTQYVRKKDRELFGKYNVIANTSGAWHVEYEGNHIALGEERTNDMFTMNSIIKSGGIVSLGSDFPVDEVGNEPLKGLEMSVTRKAFGEKDFPVLMPAEEALTLEQAIEAYTINGAYQIQMENKIGSIEVDKYADFVVLEKNLFEVEKHSIYNIPIVMTIMNGNIVYSAEQLTISE